MSRELVKVWRFDYWEQLVERLTSLFTVIQLGDEREPFFPKVLAFGGRLTKRESMAVLSHATVHVGPDSFLTHAARGLSVPSVVIFGGSRPVGCFGYEQNVNLAVNLECSPCWLHNSVGQFCPHEMECMKLVSVDQVYAAVLTLIARSKMVTAEDREHCDAMVAS
jgi:ADP-heptose:LPS heptosyltransferase